MLYVLIMDKTEHMHINSGTTNEKEANQNAGSEAAKRERGAQVVFNPLKERRSYLLKRNVSRKAFNET